MLLPAIASCARSSSKLFSKTSRIDTSLQSSMDQAAAPISHWRRLLRSISFGAPPPGGRLEASIRHLRSRLWLVLVLAAVLAVYFYFISAGGLRNWPVYGNYIDLQADAFRGGHLYLPLEPAPELLRAADPRDRVNIRYWALDLSYFRGKYYTYWGPTPALLLAVGKTLLGIKREIGDHYICLFSICLTTLGGALIIERMGRRLFGAVPRSLLIFGIFAFAFANSMLHDVTTAGTYITAIISAQAWVAMGVVFAFDTVWYAGTTSTRRYRPLLAGVCWGLALASRVTVLPTVAVLIAATALAEGWVSERRWLKTLITSLWLGAPVALVGVALLVYNKLRFDDPLQFGITLQLSGYPTMRFDRQYWLPNLYSYTLRPFVTTCQFPWIYQVWWMKAAAFPEGFSLPADYMVDEPVVGWLRAVPIAWLGVFAFWLVPRPLARFRHGRVYLWCLVSFTAMATLTGLTAIGVYAATMRYLSDVTPGLVLLGLLGAFALRTHRFSLMAPKLASSVIVLLASATIVFGCLLGYQGYAGHFHKYNRELDAELANALSFCGESTPPMPRFWP